MCPFRAMTTGGILGPCTTANEPDFHRRFDRPAAGAPSLWQPPPVWRTVLRTLTSIGFVRYHGNAGPQYVRFDHHRLHADGVQAAAVTDDMRNGGFLVASYSNGTHRTRAACGCFHLESQHHRWLTISTRWISARLHPVARPAPAFAEISWRLAGSIERRHGHRLTLIVYQRGWADSRRSPRSTRCSRP
jgi:hypothetical protein